MSVEEVKMLFLTKFKSLTSGCVELTGVNFKFAHIIGEEIWHSFLGSFMQYLKVMEIFMLGIQYAKCYCYIFHKKLFTNLVTFSFL